MQIEMDKLMELGTTFKVKRRELGLEREEVAIKIKVSAKTLHALEEAIPDSLPQPVFARGFARSYADFLGLNMKATAELIAEAFPMEPTSNINPELSSAAREQSITINQTSNAKLLAVVVPVGLIIAGLIGWFVVKTFFVSSENTPVAVSQQSTQVRPAQVSQAPAKPQPTATENAAPTQDAAPAQPEQAAQPSATEQAPAPAEQPDDARPPLNLPPNQVSQSNARGDSPIPSGHKRVVLFAKYECWVGAEFDEIGRRSFTLEAGQTFVLDFKNKLTLTLGNAGAIDMSYNGKPFDVGGRFKEARVLNFPPR